LHFPSPASSEIKVIKDRKWIVLHAQMNTKKEKETQRKERRKELNRKEKKRKREAR
jgi:hypothetical protein